MSHPFPGLGRFGLGRSRIALATVAVAVATMAAACSSSSTGDSASSTGAASSASASSPASPLPAAEVATIDRLAGAAMFNGITGVVVGIDDPVKGRLVKAYGKADTAGAAMTTDMHYRIASVSKTFTALEVLKLVDEHEVALTDPIAKYVDGVPNGASITIKDLLGMRSGLFDYTGDPAFGATYSATPTYPSWKISDVLPIVQAHQNGAPDTTTQYCNTNYVLLGQVITKITGKAIDQVIDAGARSVGLTQTTYPTTDQLPSPYAHGYLLENPPADGVSPVPSPRTREATASNPLVPYTAGAMISTVPDMLRYAALLGTGAGLDAATFAQRTTFTPLPNTGGLASYGLGVTKLGSWIGHDGSIIGYSDMVWYLPSTKTSLVVMVNEANGDRVPSQALWGQIVKALYPGTL